MLTVFAIPFDCLQICSRTKCRASYYCSYCYGVLKNKVIEKLYKNLNFRHVDTLERMTTPEEYRKNMLRILDYLNSTLTKGSTVIISGLADGRVLWDIMSDRYAAYFVYESTDSQLVGSL